jgi:translation initiation factor IF-1
MGAGGMGTRRRGCAGTVTVEGVVTEVLPRGMYRVAVGERHHVLAHAPGGPHRNFVRILVGDRVAVELASVDRTRGRIVRRNQSGKP